MTALHHYMARATESMKYSDKMIEVMDKSNTSAYAKTLSDSLIGMLYAGRNTIWRASEFGELISKPYSLEKFADRVITNDTDRKIRVGYLSCDFRVHPCGNVL
jgi:predicted O-linked N-acetylglucosamine transferase (SPINDLY family)